MVTNQGVLEAQPGPRGARWAALDWCLLLPLIAVAWWLRLSTVAPLELGNDGGLSVGLAVGTLRDLLDFSARDVHPPLYYLLLRLWIAAAGTSAVALKWLGAGAGALATAALARWCRSWGTAPALVAAAALALLPSAVIAGATVRDYSCGLAATLASVLAFWVLLERRGAPFGRWLLFGATASAGLLWYLHLPVFAVQLALALVWRRARPAAVPLLLGAACWLPWWAMAGPPLAEKLLHHVDAFGEVATRVPISRRPILEVVAAAAGWYPGPVPPVVVAGVTIGLALLGGVVAWRVAPFRVALCLASASGGFVMVVYIDLGWGAQTGITSPALVVLPFLLALASSLARGPLLAVALLLSFPLLTLPSLAAMPHSVGHPGRLADLSLALVAARRQPGDGVAFANIYHLGYYIAGGGDPSSAVAVEDNVVSFRQLGVQGRIARVLPPLEARYRRIWYVGDQDGGTILQSALDHTATLVQRWDTANGNVRLYATR